MSCFSTSFKCTDSIDLLVLALYICTKMANAWVLQGLCAETALYNYPVVALLLTCVIDHPVQAISLIEMGSVTY